jgi:hypothetical protein
MAERDYSQFNEELWLIRQLRDMAKKIGYELNLEDAKEVAALIKERVELGDGIIKV